MVQSIGLVLYFLFVCFSFGPHPWYSWLIPYSVLMGSFLAGLEGSDVVLGLNQISIMQGKSLIFGNITPAPQKLHFVLLV